MLNIAIRHSKKDNESFLNWARLDSFAFVLHFRQEKTPEKLRETSVWTRELIDHALKLDGTYYLPYQVVASYDQFKIGYPRAESFFEVKKRYDPEYRFQNELWKRYYYQK